MDKQVERVDTLMLMGRHSKATSTRTKLRAKVYTNQKISNLKVSGRLRDH
jgi:hypothetical protein